MLAIFNVARKFQGVARFANRETIRRCDTESPSRLGAHLEHCTNFEKFWSGRRPKHIGFFLLCSGGLGGALATAHRHQELRGCKTPPRFGGDSSATRTRKGPTKPRTHLGHKNRGDTPPPKTTKTPAKEHGDSRGQKSTEVEGPFFWSGTILRFTRKNRDTKMRYASS